MGSHVRRFTLFAHNNDSDTFSFNLALKMARKTRALRIKITFQIQMKVTVVMKGRLTLDSIKGISTIYQSIFIIVTKFTHFIF